MAHIGIIPDGNRRFAKSKKITYRESYERSADIVHKIVEYLSNGDLGVTMISVFICSIDNVTKRPKEELDTLFELIRINFDRYEQMAHQNKVQIRIVGHRQLFPDDIQNKMVSIMTATRDYSKLRLNLACGYDGRVEIQDAVKNLIKHADEIKVNPIEIVGSYSQFLYVPEPIDLVIRSGKEKRSSAFFPYQTAYAEWFYLDKLWPEVTLFDLKSVMNEYQKRDRRFGQ